MKTSYAKSLAGLFVLAVLISAVYLNKPSAEQLLSNILAMNGWKAFFVLSLIYVISNMLLLPFGMPINLLAGMLWGTMVGGILINLLAIFVAAISFYLGRWFGHYFLDDLFKKYASLQEMKNKINRYDWQFIALARVNPIVPFGFSNYLFGSIPDLSFKHYIIVTAIANFIPCLAFASIGSVFKTFAVINGNIQHLIFEIGIALLLISALFTLKIAMPNQHSSIDTKI